MAKLVQKFVDSYEDSGDTQDAGCVRAVLAEFVLTFLFVFTGVSAAMAAGNKIRREARGGHADGDAGGGGDRARAGGGGAGHGGVPRLGRPPEPGGDRGHDGAWPPQQAPDGAVRRRAAAGLLPRLHPPPLPHRRHGDPGARPGRGHPADAGAGDGGDPDLLPAVRDLRHDPGPAEPGAHHRAAADGAHRRRQQPRRRQLHRRVHEPGPVLRAGPGHRGLDPPLGLLARPAAGWVPRRGRLRVPLRGQQVARAAQWGLLTVGPAREQPAWLLT